MARNYEKVPILDKARAKVQVEWLSRLCCTFPNLVGRWIVGDNPVQWLLTDRHADKINWRTCAGDPNASMLPAKFTKGVMIEATGVDAPGRPFAAAFPVGKAVVAAVIPEGARQVIMGVGKGQPVDGMERPQFCGTVGTLDTERRAFFQSNSTAGVWQGQIADLQQRFPDAQRI